MTRPVYKILTYTGAVLDHTIEESVISIYTKEAITEQIGHCNITLPLKIGTRTVYDDIAEHDKVKVYFGYDTVDATPSFVGFVETISSPLRTQAGYVRQISGFSQGEILMNRIKSDKFFELIPFKS